jgi:hypothetical protein
MPTALALVADRPAPLSPRQALREHFATLAKLRAEAERTQKPATRLREQERIANEQLAAAEAELATIDAQHAATSVVHAGGVSYKPSSERILVVQADHAPGLVDAGWQAVEYGDGLGGDPPPDLPTGPFLQFFSTTGGCSRPKAASTARMRDGPPDDQRAS